jgi:hypothetical protein
MMGVYSIQIENTNYIYVGSSKKISRRKSQHLKSLREGKHYNKFLQNIFDKYKEDNLKFILLEEIQDEKILLEKEKFFIDMFISLGNYKILNVYLDPQDHSGERHGRSKLTWNKVREIRRKLLLKIPRKELAKEYGVSLGTIKQIKANEIWIEEGYSHKKTFLIKLNHEIANMIRNEWISSPIITGRKLGKKYNISPTVIYLILKGKVWKDDSYGDLTRSGWKKII